MNRRKGLAFSSLGIALISLGEPGSLRRAPERAGPDAWNRIAARVSESTCTET